MCLNTTFEASPLWRHILKHVFHLQERHFTCDGFDLLAWKHPFYPFYISTPYRDRLAIIWHDPPRALSVNELRSAVGNKRALIKDVASVSSMSEDHQQRGMVNSYTNSSVSLTGDILSHMNRAARKNWRRSNEVFKLELTVNPNSALTDFYNLYLHTRRRLGVIPYPLSLFRILLSELGSTVLLLRGSLNGRAIGYLLCYLDGNEMISAHIAYDESEQSTRITDFLYINAFLWGQKHGYVTYRFGGDYNNQTSLRAAKVKLGAVPWPQYDLATSRYRLPIAEDRPNSLIRRTLRALPMPLYRHTGVLIHAYYA